MYNTGWIAVQCGVKIDYNLEDSSLQIRTDESNDGVDVVFYSAVGNIAGGVCLFSTPTPKFWLRNCNKNWSYFPTGLPSETEKIWTIYLNKSSVRKRLIIHCNNKEVVNVLLSDTTCDVSGWSERWSIDVEKIMFTSSDRASYYYRPGKITGVGFFCIF